MAPRAWRCERSRAEYTTARLRTAPSGATSSPVPVRGLVFDLYGTLVTTGRGWRAYRELIQSLPPWQWQAARRAALTQPLPSVTALHEQFQPRRGPSAAHFERLVEEGLAEVALYDDSLATLERARAAGLQLALLSNLASPYKRPVFELGLAPHFDELVFSCDVGMAKPDPRIFRHVSERMGLPAQELVMIGDSRGDDIRGAKRVGMPALHIVRHGRGGDIKSLAEVLDYVSR